MRITAKRDSQETGLRAIGADPRGYTIKADGEEVARVFALRRGMAFEWIGWTYKIYERPELGLKEVNAWNEPGVVTPGKIRTFSLTDEGREAAKKRCMDRVRELLTKKGESDVR